MADKYKSIRKKLRKTRTKEKMCLNKTAFETKELAYQQGQDSYHCPHCNKWHRTGKLKRFLNRFESKLNE